VFGHQIVAAPHAPHAARAYLNAPKGQLLDHTQAAVGRMNETVVQNGLFNRHIETIGMRAYGTGQPVDKAIGTVHFVVATYLVELLPRIAHDFECLTDIG